MAVKLRSHRKPTEMQLKVIELLEADPELTPAEAARKAGYSPNTIKNIGKNIMNKPIVQTIMDNYRYSLAQHNINPDRLAAKMDELLDASDPVMSFGKPLVDQDTGDFIMKPDRKIQVEAMKMLHDVYGMKATPQPKNQEGVKRRITLEEFNDTIDSNLTESNPT